VRNYGKIHTAFWPDERIQSLGVHARLLACYLLTGPQSNGIGCYKLGLGYLADDLGWPAEGVASAKAEIEASGFAAWCPKTGFVLIPRYLKWNPPESGKVGVHLAKLVERVPAHFTLWPGLIEALSPHAKRLPEACLKRYGIGYPIPNREGMPFPEPRKKEDISDLSLTTEPARARSPDARQGKQAGETAPHVNGQGSHEDRKEAGKALAKGRWRQKVLEFARVNLSKPVFEQMVCDVGAENAEGHRGLERWNRLMRAAEATEANAERAAKASAGDARKPYKTGRL
jgi:hypothetical protein